MQTSKLKPFSYREELMDGSYVFKKIYYHLHNTPNITITALYGDRIFILADLSLQTVQTFDLYLSGRRLAEHTLTFFNIILRLDQ